jgi:hypothetical protein
MQVNKDGTVWKGDIPNNYLIRLSSLFNKDASIGDKDVNDRNFDWATVRIVDRLIRESTPDEEFTINDMISGMDMEAGVLNIGSMTKNGGLLKKLNTSIAETTQRNIDLNNPQKGSMLNPFNLFKRK